MSHDTNTDQFETPTTYKMIVGGRQSGRTTKLIEELDELAQLRGTGRAWLFCRTNKECSRLDRVIIGMRLTTNIVTKTPSQFTTHMVGLSDPVGVDEVVLGLFTDVDVYVFETTGPVRVVDAP